MAIIAGAPPVGLIGSEQALRQGLQGSLSVGQRGLSQAQSALRGGLGGALGFLDVGNEGLEGQAALAGLRGAPAQATAFQGFQESPGQQFLREQGERGVLRNASAIGGLGGGNVRRELSRFNQGLAAQDFGNQFQRGQQVLAAQQAPASQAANFAFGTGQGLSQNQLQNAINAQNQIFGTGQQLAGGRTQAGRDIGQNVSQTSSALSNLINQQGAGLSDIIGGSAGNVADLLRGFGATEGTSQEQLAAILSNLATGQASQLPSASSRLESTDRSQQVGQTASAIGGLMSAFSDERLKDNKTPIGELNGHTVWSWSWNKAGNELGLFGESAGFMAQEVLHKMPDAVEFDPSGYYKVNYGMVLDA
jgi:hypothetical protein